MGHETRFVTAARAGFAARGLLYGLIGFLAFQGRAEDPRGALDYIEHKAGAGLLVPLGLGFLFYGLWRLLDAAFDADGHGSDAKGAAVRAGISVIGLIYLGFAFAGFKLAFSRGPADSGGDSAEQGASAAMNLPGGAFLLYGVALAFVAGGVWQLVKAVKLKFLKRVSYRAAQSLAVKWIGRIGLAARGCVFLTVAWLFWCAARDLKASEAGGSADALGTMPPTLRAAIGIGLILFGLFSLIEAWFRVIGDPHVGDRVKRAVAS